MQNQTLSAFLDALASAAPAPGGGSVSALAGALGAALLSMTANLTIGKERYREHEEDVRMALEQSETLRARLTDLINQDVGVYNAVSSAYMLPRGTAEEKKTRQAAIQAATVDATRVPLRMIEACRAVIDLAPTLIEYGNVNLVSDVGVAVLMAEAGARSAALNVEINLAALRDKNLAAELRSEMEQLLDQVSEKKEDLVQQVVRRIGGEKA